MIPRCSTCLAELHLSDLESAANPLRQPSSASATAPSRPSCRAQNKRLGLLSAVSGPRSLLGGGAGRSRCRWSSPKAASTSLQATQYSRSGSRLAMKLVLMPQCPWPAAARHGLPVATPAPSGGFEVGTEFIDMTDAQRQLLARYILQRQQQQRRQQLEQNDPTSCPVFL